MTLDIGILLNIGLISSLDYRSKSSCVLSSIHDFLELLGWDYVLYQITRSCGYVITIAFILGCKFWQAYKYNVNIIVGRKTSKTLVKNSRKKPIDLSMKNF